MPTTPSICSTSSNANLKDRGLQSGSPMDCSRSVSDRSSFCTASSGLEVRRACILQACSSKENLMGLFDSIAGQVLGSLSNSDDGRHAGLINAIESLVNNQQAGGLSG